MGEGRVYTKIERINEIEIETEERRNPRKSEREREKEYNIERQKG
jgi:hypothetical protein